MMSALHKNQARSTNQRSFWWSLRVSRWSTLMSCVGGLLLFFVVALILRERQAAARVNIELTRLRSQGMPVDNASAAASFRRSTSREGTETWDEILNAVDQLGGGVRDELPIVGSGQLPDDQIPGGSWPEEPKVAAYLEHMRPVIEKIHAARGYATPVWQPIEFAGFETLLDPLTSSRSVSRLMALEAAHAVHQHDPERALAALASLDTVAEAFDWPLALVCELVHLALRGTHQETIQTTLEFDLWKVAEIDSLIEHVGPPLEMSARWRRMIAGERGLVLASFAQTGLLDGDEVEQLPLVRWYASMPSTKLGYLQEAAGWEQLADAGLEPLRTAAARVDRQADGHDPLISMVAPAMEAIAKAFERDETRRRLTVTALAVKKYFLENQRWPATLDELETLGIAPADHCKVGGGAFVYEVSRDSCVLATRGLLPDDEQEAARSASDPRMFVKVGNRG